MNLVDELFFCRAPSPSNSIYPLWVDCCVLAFLLAAWRSCEVYRFTQYGFCMADVAVLHVERASATSAPTSCPTTWRATGGAPLRPLSACCSGGCAGSPGVFWGGPGFYFPASWGDRRWRPLHLGCALASVRSATSRALRGFVLRPCVSGVSGVPGVYRASGVPGVSNVSVVSIVSRLSELSRFSKLSVLSGLPRIARLSRLSGLSGLSGLPGLSVFSGLSPSTSEISPLASKN